MKVLTRLQWLFALTFSTSITFGQVFPQQSSGGPASATNILSPVPRAGVLRIDYDFFTIPDTLDVFYENIDIFSSGSVAHSGRFNIPYGPGNSTNLTIVINKDPDPGLPNTAWQYTPSVVQRVLLSIAADPKGRFILTWPYMSDTTLESCSNLNAPQWQPVIDVSVTLSNGFYQGTGSIGATNRFFRLRPN